MPAAKSGLTAIQMKRLETVRVRMNKAQATQVEQFRPSQAEAILAASTSDVFVNHPTGECQLGAYKADQ